MRCLGMVAAASFWARCMARFEDTEDSVLVDTRATFIRDSGRVIISVMGDLLIVLLYIRVCHRLKGG